MDTTNAPPAERHRTASPAAIAGGSRRRRWPHLGPGQPRLLFATAGILVGSFLPWVDTAFGTFTGMAGPGVWTFYAGVLGLAGSLLRHRRTAAAHAAVAGAVAVALPVWQSTRLVTVCAGGACAPASGLFLVLGAGIFALVQASRIWRFTPGTS